MGPLLTAAAPGLASGALQLLGGVLGSRGQERANEQNIAFAREQMKFQERMSSSAYQRAASDMSKAGLNRILALGSPASTPGGATATMQNVKAPMQQAMLNASNVAANTALQVAQARLTRARATKEEITAPIASKAGEAVGNFMDKVPEITPEKTLEGAKTAIEVLKARGSEIWKWLKETNEDAKQLILDQQKKTEIRESFDQAWKSVDIDPEKGKTALLQTLDKMDIPPGMTDEEKMAWAAANMDKVRAYLDRQREMLRR